MTKRLSVASAALLFLAVLASCSGRETSTSVTASAASQSPRHIHIGVLYLLEHPAINAGLDGLRTRLKEISAEDHVEFDASYVNAFGDAKTAAEAVDGFHSRNVDAVVALTTPCAQIAHQKIKDRPVVFVGISDPVAAGLVDSLSAGKDNVIGTTSRPSYLKILRTATEAFPKLRTIGIIYSSQEANSVSAVQYLESTVPHEIPGIALRTRTVANTAEISSVARALLRSVDGIFVLDDNATVSAVEVIVAACKAAKKPVFACDVDSVRRGALFTHAIDYKKEGIAAADLLREILVRHRAPSTLPVAQNTATTFYVNQRIFKDFSDVSANSFSSAEHID